MKPTEIVELKRMDVIEFYQYLNSYTEKLDKKIAANSKITSRYGKGKT